MTCSAKATFWWTFLFGSRRKSWNTQPIERRSAGTFQCDIRDRSLPATCTVPAVGASSLSSSRRKVLLPEPLEPTRKTNSPRSMSTSTSSSAGRTLDG